MKYIITLVAVFYSAMTFSTGPGGRRCVTTEHMKEVRAKHALKYPDANFSATPPQNTLAPANVIFYIPVVVHVLWNTTGQNISDAQIYSQIAVLNEDYSRTNSDAIYTPGAFSGIASSTNFQFCLATVDPSGNPTNGIQRRQTTHTVFQTDDNMKFFSTGGLNAWDTDRYLNIWVCNMGEDILGYAETPDIVPHTNTFGVVISYNAFGRTGTATPPYHLGRTTTHEVGHCFNLWHIWGDDNGACSTFGDGVADTPDQARETFNCVNFPLIDSCSNTYPGVMFMNYMDYSDDNCMNAFTAGQANRMYTEINNYYPSLLYSTGCGNIGIEEERYANAFNIYPNPADGIINISMSESVFRDEYFVISVMSSIGELILETNLKASGSLIQNVDLGSHSKGVYFINIRNEKFNITKRVVVQ